MAETKFRADKRHIRHCILFCFQLKKTALQAKETICRALDDENAVSYSTCKKWYARFRIGNYALEDDERPGKPRTVADDDLDQLLKENPSMTQAEIAAALGVTRQTISMRLKKRGKIKKAICENVPEEEQTEMQHQ